MSVALRCERLAAGRDGRVVVHDVDLAVEAGEVVALLGPNGAGKTTTLLTIAGLLPAMSGSVFLHGSRLGRRRPHRLVRDGLVLVPDNRGLFRALTVRQHLELARNKASEEPTWVLDRFPPLRKRIDVAAGSLSGGEQQMLAIGRALMLRPSVLLIDELSLGLAPIVVHELLPMVARTARDLGAAVVLVEQHVSLALEIADRAVVLAHGRTALEDEAAVLRQQAERIEAAYFDAPAEGTRTRSEARLR